MKHIIKPKTLKDKYCPNIGMNCMMERCACFNEYQPPNKDTPIQTCYWIESMKSTTRIAHSMHHIRQVLVEDIKRKVMKNE